MNRKEEEETQRKCQNTESRKLDKNERYESDSAHKTNSESKITDYGSIFF